MKLFVDDKRTPPNKGFECAEDYESAVFLLKYIDFDFVTLDYDLGDGNTGLDILKFMYDNKKYPSHINIHSDHPEGSVLMRKYVEENFPDTVVTMNANN